MINSKYLHLFKNMKILHKIRCFSRRKKIAGIFSFILLILLINYFVSGSAIRNIKTAKVKRGEIVISQTETGELQASKNVMITAASRTIGQLQIIDMIDEGTTVKKGDTLIQFDTKNVEEVVKSREDQLLSLEEKLEKLEAQQAMTMEELYADLNTIKNNYELAELSVENMKYESENKRQEARLQYDNAKLNYDDQISKIENQKIINRVNKNDLLVDIKKAKNNFEWAKKALKDLTVTAPSPGLIVYNEIWSFWESRKIKEGDIIHPRQTLIQLPDVNEFQVRLKVNEIDVDKYKLGLEVNVTLDAYPEKLFKGVVTEISPLVEGFVENLRLFNVIITLNDNDPEILRPGMTVRAEICLKKISDALYVPVESVFEKDGKPIVFSKGLRFNQKTVSLGDRNESYIVINDNLKEGEEIALIDPTGEADRLGTAREQELRLERRKEIIERFVNGTYVADENIEQDGLGRREDMRTESKPEQ